MGSTRVGCRYLSATKVPAVKAVGSKLQWMLVVPMGPGGADKWPLRLRMRHFIRQGRACWGRLHATDDAKVVGVNAGSAGVTILTGSAVGGGGRGLVMAGDGTKFRR